MKNQNDKWKQKYKFHGRNGENSLTQNEQKERQLKCSRRSGMCEIESTSGQRISFMPNIFSVERRVKEEKHIQIAQSIQCLFYPNYNQIEKK